MKNKLKVEAYELSTEEGNNTDYNTFRSKLIKIVNQLNNNKITWQEFDTKRLELRPELDALITKYNWEKRGLISVFNNFGETPWNKKDYPFQDLIIELANDAANLVYDNFRKDKPHLILNLNEENKIKEEISLQLRKWINGRCDEYEAKYSVLIYYVNNEFRVKVSYIGYNGIALLNKDSYTTNNGTIIIPKDYNISLEDDIYYLVKEANNHYEYELPVNHFFYYLDDIEKIYDLTQDEIEDLTINFSLYQILGTNGIDNVDDVDHPVLIPRIERLGLKKKELINI